MAKTTTRQPRAANHNLNAQITPLQMVRLRQDVGMWRRAVAEAEWAYYPYRVKMQQMFIDTILNGHVGALMERRNDLTLLRDYTIHGPDGQPSAALTEEFKEHDWFLDFISHALEAEFFGYSLISLGDIVQGSLEGVSVIRRWNISPERYQVGKFPYDASGIDFREAPYTDWHVYVTTRSDTGVSPCGYGLLYKVALYEIFLRNTLGFNGDFVELYAQPYRVGYTTKTTEAERAELEMALQRMGSSGYAVLDQGDEIKFLETALGGTGYKGYESLEDRCQKTVSKLILGHADALDSTPGKLGSAQGGTQSPAALALADKQTKDGRKIQGIINQQLFPRLTRLGLGYPEGIRLRYNNDAEAEEVLARKNTSAKALADIYQTVTQAGGTPDWAQFTAATGIQVR